MSVERESLRAELLALGFDEVRFAAVVPESGANAGHAANDPGAHEFGPHAAHAGAGEAFGAGLQSWLAAGYHADMAWLERTASKRADPTLVLPGARTLIMLGVTYWREGEVGLAGEGAGAGKGEADGDANRAPPSPEATSFAASASAPLRWARYAQHLDYHDTIKPGLEAAGRVLERRGGLGPTDYRYYVDTGPVLERAWAARSGLGFIGKNAMMISRRHGNWLLLATILTRWAIPPDAPVKATARGRETEPGLLCGKCTRCLDACPTLAFPRPGVVDARRCVSYHTIENKGLIPREFRAAIGDRLYGCDTCLEVCPWNRFAQAGREMLLVFRGDMARLTLTELLELTPERFAAVFKGTPIKRLKLIGLLRNAALVAANTRATACLPALRKLASGHVSSLVRAHAVWALRVLGEDRARAADWGQQQALETDPLVLAEYVGEL